MNKKIFIIDSFSLNTGDMAILISLCNLLKKKFPSSSISIEVSHPNVFKKSNRFRSIRIFPRIIDIQYIYTQKKRYSLLKILPLNIYDSFSFTIWAILGFIDFDAIWIIRNSRRAQAVEFKSADIIISTGGGFLSTYYMYGLRLYTLSLAFLLKKKVVLLSQSIGPFNTTLSRILIPLFLNKASIISVREPSSYRYLKRMKIKTHIYETSDLAFLLPYKIRSVKNRKKIIVCIKNYKGQVGKEYKETIKKITEKLLSQGYKIVILSQTVNDDTLGQEIKDSFKNNVEFVEFTPSVDNTIDLYSKCDFVISSRMHGIIFAILSKVPFISIGDEPKFLGLLEQVEYSNKLSINVANIEIKKLSASVDFLIKNHFQIRRDIINKRTMLITRANQNINILEKLI